jgi:hypothetical protein
LEKCLSRASLALRWYPRFERVDGTFHKHAGKKVWIGSAFRDGLDDVGQYSYRVEFIRCGLFCQPGELRYFRLIPMGFCLADRHAFLNLAPRCRQCKSECQSV